MSSPSNRGSDPLLGESDPGTEPRPQSDLVSGEATIVSGGGAIPAEQSDLGTIPAEQSDLVAADLVVPDEVPVAADKAPVADHATGPAEPAPAVGPPRDFRRLLRRFGPAVVAIGIAVFASPLASRWPSTQTVEIALDSPGGVTRVSLDVTPLGEQDPVYTAAWTFDPGTAPQRIRAEWSAPNGRYDATIGVIRAGAAATDETKHIDLDGNRITLFPR